MSHIVARQPARKKRQPVAVIAISHAAPVAAGFVFGMLALPGMGADALVLLFAAAGVALGWWLRPKAHTAAPGKRSESIDMTQHPAASSHAVNAERSLQKRERRIHDLKRRLSAARTDYYTLLEQTRGTIESQREIIAGLEDALLATLEPACPGADENRSAALEQDLAATNAVIESLQDDVDYWRRRAVH